MRSIPRPLSAANINLRGKKELRLSCGCCIARDFRDKVAARMALLDVDEALTETDSLDVLDIYEMDALERRFDPEFDYLIEELVTRIAA